MLLRFSRPKKRTQGAPAWLSEWITFFPSLEQLARLCRRSDNAHRQALFCQLVDQKRHNQSERLCRRSEKTHRQALFCQLIDQKRHNQSERLCRRSEKTHRQALFCQLVDQKRHNQSTMRRRLLACAAARLPHRHFGCIRCITSEK